MIQKQPHDEGKGSEDLLYFNYPTQPIPIYLKVWHVLVPLPLLPVSCDRSNGIEADTNPFGLTRSNSFPYFLITTTIIGWR